MFDSTDTKTSEVRRRLLALIPVAALMLIFASVFAGMRTAVPAPSSPSVTAPAAPDAASVAPPSVASNVATDSDWLARLARRDAELYPPTNALSAPTAAEAGRSAPAGAATPRELVQMEAAGLVTLARPSQITEPSAILRLGQLDAQLYPLAPVAEERSSDR